MSEQKDERTIFSLLEVTKSIQKTITERYKVAFWVKAEMNRLNLHPPSGHSYPELVEKKDGRIIAEIKSTLWKEDYQRINANFLRILKEPLKNGINILFSAKITYDPVYGLSLRILDIDPSFSLGELEREKQETIDRLKSDGIYDANRLLPMPVLPKRIAIISVETSKGYSDFIKTIENNIWGYNFFYMLFPAILQGERSVESIIGQLKRIKHILHHFDAVAIIRGGGGEVGLTCYNDYRLCRAIALYPIPVITGIGHSTNETVSEMIAHKNAITPTDLADYLLQKFHNFAVPVQQARESLISQSKRLLRDQQLRLLNAVKYFRSATGSLLIRRDHEVQQHAQNLRRQAGQLLQTGRADMERTRSRLADRAALLLAREHREIIHLEKNIAIMDPVNVLKRGYSITLKNGKAINDAAELREGDQLTTMLLSGSVTSVVEQVNKTEPNESKQE